MSDLDARDRELAEELAREANDPLIHLSHHVRRDVFLRVLKAARERDAEEREMLELLVKKARQIASASYPPEDLVSCLRKLDAVRAGRQG